MLAGESWTVDSIREEVAKMVEAEEKTKSKEQDKGDSSCLVSSNDPEPDDPKKDGRFINGFDSAYVLECLAGNMIGDAKMFVRLHRGLFIFDHSGQLWYFWAGHYWKVDLTGRVIRAMQRVVEQFQIECDRISWRINSAKARGAPEAEVNRLLQLEKHIRGRVQALQTRQRIRDVLELARSGSGPDSLSTDGNEWDLNPMLLTCQNCVIDLTTGESREGLPGDMNKTAAPVEWRGLNEHAPGWKRFISEIFNEIEELIWFIQRLCGYFLTGKIHEEIFPIFLGGGRNGKSKLVEAIKAIMGDYAGTTQIETLIEQKNSGSAGGARADLMALRGKRFMSCSESEDGHRLNAGIIKSHTGGDKIPARAPFGHFQIEFSPTHKPLLLSNFAPKINSDDPAIWARILKIPFNVTFVDEPSVPNERRKDRHLADKLQLEYPGILAWMVQGCLEWQRTGLQPPAIVRAATSEYRAKNDMLADFLETCCQERGEIQAKVAYDAYAAYCSESGISPLTMNKFTDQMVVRFDRYAKNHKKFYIGISLLTD